MEACKGLGLLVILVVSLLFCGVAEADNPCYAECFTSCIDSFTCMLNPTACAASCGITCGLHDTCKHSIRKVLLPNSVKQEEAVTIQHNTIEKNSVAVQVGNPCYAECLQDCLNACGFNPWGCAACSGTCAVRNTCRDIKITSGKRAPVEHKEAEEEAVAIQRNTIEKNSVAVQVGNPCYAECVQDCLNACGMNPWGCAACSGSCGIRDTCKDKKITSGKRGDVAAEKVPRALLLNSHVADE